MSRYVVKVSKSICEEFVLNKHYSRRASIFWAGYALIENEKIEGVCVFGQPSPPIQKHAFNDRDFRLYELSRLVIQSKTKNSASFLISNALKLLEPKPCAVVSFADTEWNHCGFVYQATNWIYTGSTVSHDHMYLIDGKRVHPISLRDKGITNPKEWAKNNNIQTLKPLPKHRYFQFVGSKKQKKQMLEKLNYPVIEKYPKINPNRYDDGEKIEKYINSNFQMSFL
jgi:hypothetical protein